MSGLIKQLQDLMQTKKRNSIENYENTADKVEKTLRELKYPPLNGGPTKEDIIDLLEEVMATWYDQETGTTRDVSEIYDEVSDAVDDLEKVISNLRSVL
jgi:hypothetical protein